MKIGDEVKVLSNTCSVNKKGDIGFVADIDAEGSYKVNVKDRLNSSNWHSENDLQLIEEVNETKGNYDYINPDHYKKGSVEVFDMIVSIYGKDKAKIFCELNAFKYRMRLGGKPDNSIEQEYEKIKWYEDKIKELC